MPRSDPVVIASRKGVAIHVRGGAHIPAVDCLAALAMTQEACEPAYMFGLPPSPCADMFRASTYRNQHPATDKTWMAGPAPDAGPAPGHDE